MCVLSIKVPIWKKSGNLFNDPHIYILFKYIYIFWLGLLCIYIYIYKVSLGTSVGDCTLWAEHWKIGSKEETLGNMFWTHDAISVFHNQALTIYDERKLQRERKTKELLALEVLD